MSKSILGFLLTLVLALPLRAEQPIFDISSLDANPGEIVDIDFHVDNFTDIISVQYSVNWNPSVLQFRAVKNFNPNVPGLSPSVFGTNQTLLDQGKLTLSWIESSINPITLPDGSLFFTIEFEVIGNPCQSSNIAITNDPLEIEVAEEGEVEVGLISNVGEVNVPGTGCTEGINFIGNSIVGACGSEVCIQFTVENFITVGAMEFSLVYDPSVLMFDHFQNFGPLPGFNEGNTNLLSPGTIRVVWFNSNAGNDTLPDGTVLFEICFDVIGSGGQSSEITFGNNPSVMISDSDGNFHTVNMTPAEITAQCALEGFALIADTVCTTPGEIVCMDILVNDFDDIVGLQFSMNWDSNLFVFHHVEGFGLPGLNAEGFGTPENPDVNEGELTVSWLDLSLEGVTVPDFSSIFTVCLEAIGPAGSTSTFTFTDDPIDIEIATLDSVLSYSLLQGQAQIRLNCDNPPCEISYTLTPTSPDCPREATGSLDLELDTGSCPDAPTFAWSFGGVTSEDLINVEAGTYTVTITVGSQIVVASGTITDPPPMGASGEITNPNPPGSSTGSINLTVSGGMPPYTFSWSNGSTSEDLSNIIAGTYTVTITDAKGCTFIPDPFIVGADVAATVTHVICAGSCTGAINLSPAFGTPPFTYLWSNGATSPNINNLCAGLFCVTITDNSGSTRDTCFTINEPDPLVVTATITHSIMQNGGAIDLNVTGGTLPYKYQWSNPPGTMTQDINNLAAGQYCVTVTYGQNNVCSFDTCFTILEGGIGLSLVASQFGSFQTSCHNVCDGEITSVVSGGIPPISYQWSTGATTPDLGNLCPGIYGLTITDAAGNVATSSRVITAPPAINITANEIDPTDVSSHNGSITVIANGGVPPYTYQWTGPIFASTPTLNNLGVGTYTITVKDANQCSITESFSLIPDGFGCYEANRIITPNDDGKNDFFIITCVENSDNHLFIFNRNGGLVYETDDYQNNWTATDNDSELLPDGGYLWVLEYLDGNGVKQIVRGTVNVLRTAD